MATIEYTGENTLKALWKRILGQINTVADGKVDKVSGKGLSTEDFTTDLKKKLEALSSGSGSADLSGYALKSDVPTKVSQLTNDSGYLTSHQSLADYAKKSDVPSKTSQLTNDSGFLTKHQDLSAYAKKEDIPSKVSQLTNDAGYLTEHQDISGLQEKLVSGTNIKTINGNSILGSGDITIQSGESGGEANVIEGVQVDGTDLPVTDKKVNIDLSSYSTAKPLIVQTTGSEGSYIPDKTYEEVDAAIQAGRTVYLSIGNFLYNYLGHSNLGISFGTIWSDTYTPNSYSVDTERATNLAGYAHVGIYTLLQSGSLWKYTDYQIQPVLAFDDTPTKDSDNVVLSKGIYAALEKKQDTLTIDSALSSDSTNPVQNRAINLALADKVDAVEGKGLSTNDLTDERLKMLNDLYDKTFPITLSVSGGGSYNAGTTQTVTVKWTLSRNGETLTPDSVTINGTAVDDPASGSQVFENVTATTTYSVSATYGSTTKTGSVKATFISNYTAYYGVVDSTKTAATLTEADITALTSKSITSKSGTFSVIADSQKFVYAYPSALGQLSSVKEKTSGYEVLSSQFESPATISVGGVSCLVYINSDVINVDESDGYSYVIS